MFGEEEQKGPKKRRKTGLAQVDQERASALAAMIVHYGQSRAAAHM